LRWLCITVYSKYRVLIPFWKSVVRDHDQAPWKLRVGGCIGADVPFLYVASFPLLFPWRFPAAKWLLLTMSGLSRTYAGELLRHQGSPGGSATTTALNVNLLDNTHFRFRVLFCSKWITGTTEKYTRNRKSKGTIIFFENNTVKPVLCHSHFYCISMRAFAPIAPKKSAPWTVAQ